MSNQVKINPHDNSNEMTDSIPGQIPFYKFEESELVDFDPNATVATAEDYLKSVIIEARKQPDFTRAEVKTAPHTSKALDRSELTFKQLSSSSFICASNFQANDKIDKKYLPSSQWREDRLRIFDITRNQVGNHAGKLKSIRRESKMRPRLPIFPLPEPNDFEAWQKILFGRRVPFVQFGDQMVSDPVPVSQIPQDGDSTERLIDLDQVVNGMPPVLRVVLRLTSHQISGLFDLFAELIEQNQAIQPELAEWIYAVLSVQTTPYEPAVASRIRSICKNCRNVRSKIVQNGQAENRNCELTSFNLLILIISTFFDQKDLADE